MSIPGQQAADALVRRIGVSIDPDLLVLALTHRSFAYEAGGLPTNERLEFLGDSVLGIVVTDHLYHAHPDLPEGELAKMRAACVSQKSLAVVARQIELGPCILLGKGETATGGSNKDSILCDAFEAILGAVYLTHGIETSRDVVMRLVGPSLAAAARSGAALDWKTSLQERCAELGLPAPVYDVEGEGPDHARVFTARAVVDGQVRGQGTGTAKKHAEQEAAAAAYASLEDAPAEVGTAAASQA
ncbi:ribonuclease III [Demequina zhanjiangensis]|uniref:Ribonuclease 3 n=1 Tax=Demequina zhanjiangensis TaxID=3051659 RepID=A0ABT8G4V2_9MICO|nr:ribonuclease III [Demequina sp. SYSU T00b26]MDN4474138.1 ribonuclease III [Demequina sp. SYSU T00b26]